MLPFILAAVGGYLIGNSISSKEKFSDGGTTDAIMKANIKKLEEEIEKHNDIELKPLFLQKLYKLTGDEKYLKQIPKAEKELREKRLKEIEYYVKRDGTLVQEDDFEQVPVLHLKDSIKIKGVEILYVGDTGVYSESGTKFSYSKLSDDEIRKIYDAS